MARHCIECDADMEYDKKLQLWRCPNCNLTEEGEEPLYEEEKQRYPGFKQGGPLRSQKR